MQPVIIISAGLIFLIVMLNFFFFVGRTFKKGRKSKGRDYTPPVEAKQMQWRDKEIARRLQNEQDAAFERVKLRNETLQYYETIRQRYAKLDVLERFGIDIDEDEVDKLKSLGLANLAEADNIKPENLIKKETQGEDNTGSNDIKQDSAADERVEMIDFNKYNI